MPKKLNTQFGGRPSFALIQQQGGVPLTFPSVPTAHYYVLMLRGLKTRPCMNAKHPVCSLKRPVFIHSAHALLLLLLALYLLVEWKRTSGGSDLCAAMGLLRWSIIYYGTRPSAGWQMPVREMGPGRSELGYWPQHPRQPETAYRDSLWWQVAVFLCFHY